MLKGFAAAACLCALAVAAAEPLPLSGQEISDLVAGATVEIDAPLGFKVPLRYTRDGRVFGEASAALALILGAARDTGRWWVEPDQICHKWKIWFNGYPQCFRMTKEGQTYYWRTFDDKTGTAAIVVPAPRVQTAAVAQPSLPEAGVARAPHPATAKPTPSTETPRPVPKPTARPAAAKRPADDSAEEEVAPPRVASSHTPSSAVPSSQMPSSGATNSGAPSSSAPSSGAPSSGTPSPGAPNARAPVPNARAPSSRADGAARARIQSAPAHEPAFMVVNVARGNGLNVRKGPSDHFEVVGRLPPGSRGVTVTGACQSRWCPVKHPSARGWVNSAYLVREEPLRAGTDAPAGRTGRAGATNN